MKRWSLIAHCPLWLLWFISLTAGFVSLDDKQTPEVNLLRDDEDSNNDDLAWQSVESVLMGAANALAISRWRYSINVTEENAADLLESTVHFRAHFLSVFMQGEGEDGDLEQRMNEGLKRLWKTTLLSSQMETIYSTAKVCRYDDTDQCDLSFEPDLVKLMATSTNFDELKYYWVKWHDAVGKRMRKLYMEYLSLNTPEHTFNTVAQGMKKYVYDGYTEEDFQNDLNNVWLKVKPLYVQLYTYVRRVLATKVYKGEVKLYGRLPSHVLGVMGSQSWHNIAKLVLPFPKAPSTDTTDQLTHQKYDARKMFQLAESYYTGLGLEPMTESFWRNSMIEKPNDREVVCHPSAQDFLFGPGNDTSLREDYRIKMCTQIKHEDLLTILHEMGHVEYSMAYKHQSLAYRDSANPGFHEAIGDTVSLSFSTPSHLRKIGLLPEANTEATEPLFDDLPPPPDNVTEQELNYLLSQAMSKVAFLPFGLMVDLWRQSAFHNETGNNLNSFWWELRGKLQGIKEPVERTELDFDPGSIYHIAADIEYTRYFVSTIAEFQLYEGLCKTAGLFDSSSTEKPLFKCDFSNNKSVGTRLKHLMEAGSSQPWPDLLEYVSGYREMNATSILTYFEPLHKWLVKANEDQCLGWETNCEQFAADYMANVYEKRMSELEYHAAVANWNYQTNLTEANAENMTEWSKRAAIYDHESLEEYLTQFEYEKFNDTFLKRQFHLLISQDTAALTESDFVQITEAVNYMTEHYSTSKVCTKKNTKCAEEETVGLDTLEAIFASNTTYDKLVYVWRQWRDVASKPLRPIYEKYVELSNGGVTNTSHEISSLPRLLPYEMDNIQEEVETLLRQIKPLYEKIHAFTRMKLRSKYKRTVIPKDNSPIPIVVLGDMLGQTWGNLFNILIPFPDSQTADPTIEMENQNWNVRGMFRVAEEFFTSLGLEPMPTSYDADSMIEKPTDRNVNCHPSSWDFGNGKDFRITMCAGVDIGNMLPIVHELGHIQYYQQYKHLPITFRQSANPAFHEAIGDVIALSFTTPSHLRRLRLIPDYQHSKEADLNFLMKAALDKVVFLPSAYVIERWRWGVFRGEFPPSTWTYHWLRLTEEYQGIVPPVQRSENDFDPGAKFHVVADEDYIGYFFATILQFQIYRSLCLASGNYEPNNPDKPLYRCDIYNSTEAGDILRKIMRAGASKPWRETLADATGTDKLDASPILEYFELLDRYLTEQLELANETVGWRSTFEQYYNNDNADPMVYIGIAISLAAALFLLVALVCHCKRNTNKTKNNMPTVNYGMTEEAKAMLNEYL